jgi:hypothetical protein
MENKTNMTDYRALCAELLRSLENYPVQPSRDRDLCVRARAALAQPEPVAPTVMQILALSDEIEAEELGTIDLVRRALARWGTPANTINQEDYDRG